MTLVLRTSHARALLAMEGYTAEVEEAYAQAMAPFEGAAVPQLFPVLRGLANFYIYRAEFEKGAEMARAILRLAETEDGARFEGDGHLILGASLGFFGDLAGGTAELEAAIDWFDTHPYQAGRFRLGTDPRVASLSTSAFQLWLAGRIDRSLERSARSVALARSLDQPSSMAYGLYHSGFLHYWRREPEIVRERALEVIEVSDEHDLKVWGAIGTCLLGAATAALGKGDEGLGIMTQGIDRYTGLRTPPVFWPLLMYMRAGVCLEAGRPAEGLPAIDEALGLMEGRPDGLLAPELLIRKGDVLRALDGGCSERASAILEQARTDAARLGTRTLELRAAVRLLRCELAERHEGGRGVRAAPSAEALAHVLDTFTEGHDIRDLIDARELLGRTG